MDLSHFLCFLATAFCCTHLCGCANTDEDYYTTLGVERGASHKQIKEAFRNLALKYHPDKNKDEGAADKFQEIVKAYEILSDPDKRQVYDTHGTYSETPANIDLSDFFKQFDEALKGFNHNPHGQDNNRFRSGNTGSFFNFEGLFSDTDKGEENVFASFGRNAKGSGKKVPPSFSGSLSDLLGDILAKHKKHQAASNKAGDQRQGSENMDDKTGDNSQKQDFSKAKAEL